MSGTTQYHTAHTGRGPGEPITSEWRAKAGTGDGTATAGFARRQRIPSRKVFRLWGCARPAWQPEVGREAMWSGAARRELRHEQQAGRVNSSGPSIRLAGATHARGITLYRCSAGVYRPGPPVLACAQQEPITHIGRRQNPARELLLDVSAPAGSAGAADGARRGAWRLRAGQHAHKRGFVGARACNRCMQA